MIRHEHVWQPINHIIIIDGMVSDAEVIYEGSTQTLTCTSSGGPATIVTWTLDESPIVVDGDTYQTSQIVTDAITATYRNLLTIVAKSAALSGTYTCSVGNARGVTTASTTISGNILAIPTPSLYIATQT